MPTTPKIPSPLYEPPDASTMTPEAREALRGQPWFQQLLKMNQAGVQITQEFAQKLATQPGAQGFHAQEIDLGDGRKARAVIDRATGKVLGESELNLPFTPSIEVMEDPVNKEKVAVLRETPTSVRKLSGKNAGGPIDLQPMRIGGKVVGLAYFDEDGKPKPMDIPKNPISGEILPEYKSIMDSFGGDAKEAGVQAPAPAAAKAAAPAAASGTPTVKSMDDWQKLPSGAVYRDAQGRTFRKK